MERKNKKIKKINLLPDAFKPIEPITTDRFELLLPNVF